MNSQKSGDKNMTFNYLNQEEFNKEIIKSKKYLIGKPMTLIIGIKCVDGVVLAGDRRLKKGDTILNGKKITKLFPNFTFGYSGPIAVRNKFVDVIKKYLELNKPSEDWTKFINYIEDQVAYLNKRYSDRVGQFDVLYCTTNPDGHAKLIHILSKGVEEEREPFDVTGCGTPYALPFLHSTDYQDMDMDKASRLCSFILKLLDNTQLDSDVGGKPQIIKISDNGDIEELSDQKIDSLLRQLDVEEKLKTAIFN